MKILYFSGTGNSLFLAKQFNCELLSIPQMIKENRYEFEDDKIGIVVPVYYLKPPKIVKEFLENVTIKSDYTFLILTYGGVHLDTFKHFKIHTDYVNYVKMPDNFIYFDMKKVKAEEETLENKMYEKLKTIKVDIENKKIRQDKFFFKSLISLTASKIVSKLLKLETKHQDECFYINDKCNLCSVCTKVCPVNNIEVTNKVNFLSKCEQCMACIQTCPSNAIQHEKQRNNARFINRNITLEEIIESNNIS